LSTYVMPKAPNSCREGKSGEHARAWIDSQILGTSSLAVFAFSPGQIA
jgi:hypothetical protein